jgi:splicing factor 3A subunit 3
MDKYGSRRGSNSRRAQRRENSSAESHASRVDYLTYLSCFHEFAEIPESDKLQSPDYQTYLVDLKMYLLDFYRKTQPLVDLDDVIAETRARFDKQWALHEIKGWDQQEPGTENGGSQPPPLFCTVCDKQFTSEGVYTSHFSGKKHKKAAAAIAANSSASSSNGNGSAATNGTSKKNTIRETIAFDEILIRRLHELLTEVIHGTISYLEVKQTRTHDELQAEIAEEEEGAFSDVDVDNALGDDNEDDDQPIYNPLNLPLGWDGKPIPYWLYKLHGLGMEFKCEICGNHSYWGRRDFDRHFQQWRHAHGMRCLGIPNTKHFHDITLISDAKARTYFMVYVRGSLFGLVAF